MYLLNDVQDARTAALKRRDEAQAAYNALLLSGDNYRLDLAFTELEAAFLVLAIAERAQYTDEEFAFEMAQMNQLAQDVEDEAGMDPDELRPRTEAHRWEYVA